MRAPHFLKSLLQTPIHRAVAISLAAASMMVTAPVAAEIPTDCGELGIAITEHSCFHAVLGPFASVKATAGTEATSSTLNIDPVHTEYRIGLAGEYSVVTYTPEFTGSWAVLLGKDVPLQVLAGPAEALPSVFEEKGTTDCDALPVLHVFELTKDTKYRFVFGPTDERTVVAVVEYVDAFVTQNGRDADGDGFGSKSEVIESPCEPPEGFAPNTRDCNDADPLIHPNAEEICGDGVDQNCNGSEGDVGFDCRVGSGACVSQGQMACSGTGSTAMCAATPLKAEQEACNGVDDDCNGKIDDAADLCTDPDRPKCVRSGRLASCGCQLDLDCGSATSGRICNTDTGACQDGCSSIPGSNGCDTGEVCSAKTARCELDTGGRGDGGAGGDAGRSGSGGVSGSAPSMSGAPGSEGGEPGSQPADDGGQDDEGCGCRAAGPPSSKGSAIAFLGIGLALYYSRRRRRRGSGLRLVSAALVAGSLVGCGGRMLMGPEDTDGGAAPSATGGTAAGGTASAVGGTPLGGSGGADQPPGGCVPALGTRLIEHVCSHTTNGPFIAALAGSDVDPPDLSELHRTYEVQLAGAEGLALYRAQRGGSHAFLTDGAVSIALLVGGEALRAEPSFPVAGCSTVEHATVYELQRGSEYELRFTKSVQSFNLFVEHLGGFGKSAWLQSCDEGSEP